MDTRGSSEADGPVPTPASYGAEDPHWARWRGGAPFLPGLPKPADGEAIEAIELRWRRAEEKNRDLERKMYFLVTFIGAAVIFGLVWLLRNIAPAHGALWGAFGVIGIIWWYFRDEWRNSLPRRSRAGPPTTRDGEG